MFKYSLHYGCKVIQRLAGGWFEVDNLFTAILNYCTRAINTCHYDSVCHGFGTQPNRISGDATKTIPLFQRFLLIIQHLKAVACRSNFSSSELNETQPFQVPDNLLSPEDGR